MTNCISLGVGNTSVNVGRYNSPIVKFRKKKQNCVLMGCPCHIARNTALQAVTKVFCKVFGDRFDVNDFLIDLCFHLDWSSKRKKNIGRIV